MLDAEMKTTKLNILGYVQELLLRRYEALRDKPGSTTKSPAGSARRGR